MLISKAMNAKLNDQITHEFGASQSYLAMACMFERQGLKSLAGFFRKQTEEEREHALKILDYVLGVGGNVALAALAAPRPEFPSALSAIQAAVKHEMNVTAQINDLVALADKEKDYATRSFLQWFIDEQVEEVSSIEHLARIASLAGNNLLQLESYLRHTLAPKAG